MPQVPPPGPPGLRAEQTAEPGASRVVEEEVVDLVRVLVLDDAPGAHAQGKHPRVEPDVALARVAADLACDVNRHVPRQEPPVERARGEGRTNRRTLACSAAVERIPGSDRLGPRSGAWQGDG